MSPGPPIGSRELKRLFADALITVSERPEPVPVEHRRAWRIGSLLLALSYCRSNRASRQKLALLNFALRNPPARDVTVQVLTGELSPFFLVLRVDPALGRALDFAWGEGLILPVGGSRLELGPQGIILAKEIVADDSLMVDEKAFLERVRTLATEKRVKEILDWR